MEIFNYKYWTYEDDPHSKEDPPKKMRVECIGSFESPIEGEVDKINVAPNEEITHSNIDILHIKEACAHTVQYGGLCALCGKSLDDEKDYSGYDYEERASIAMSHDNTELRISYDEAAKIEHNTTDRLNQERKLILVVDLDQTVIHATVDPTVGEWQLDPENPNYPAVKDVRTFCLEEDPVAPPGWNGPKLAPTKCWYYVKVRPGLAEFLKKMDEKYEMHIYTMATRNYALSIAKIIDPEGKYFGDRILSRDESGSLTHKNLKRLFPVDQSMVVIIDDRGDVWQWENNLIKVVPYDFFVGIGDINSSFLPKKNGQLTGPVKKRKSIAKLEAAAELKIEQQQEREDQEKRERELELEREREREREGEREQGNSQENDDEQEKGQGTDQEVDFDKEKELIKLDESSPELVINPVERILELGGGEGNTNLLLEQSLTRNQSIEQQQHDRPLAKLQHDLEQLHERQSEGSKSGDSLDEADVSDEEDNLLYDDDNELFALDKVLQDVHREYYTRYDSNPGLSNKPNLTEIIPQMKSKTLAGITILFSGIIPLGVPLDSADIVIWCKQFGVNVVNEVYPDVTHVICRDISEENGPTFKVRVAQKLYGDKVKIVNPDWLFSCLSSWSLVDETEYLIPTNNPKLWTIKDNEVEKYTKRLEDIKKAKSQAEASIESDDPFANFDYDIGDANQEVDEFLAELSDDDDDDDADADADDNEDEDHNDVGDGTNVKDDREKSKRKNGNHDKEIGEDLSTSRKRAFDDLNDDEMEDDVDDDDDDELQDEQAKSNGHDSFIKDMYSKKRKVEDDADGDGPTHDGRNDNVSSGKDGDVDLEDLEQELLDGFIGLEE